MEASGIEGHDRRRIGERGYEKGLILIGSRQTLRRSSRGS
jgi:hypothetical protein